MLLAVLVCCQPAVAARWVVACFDGRGTACLQLRAASTLSQPRASCSNRPAPHAPPHAQPPTAPPRARRSTLLPQRRQLQQWYGFGALPFSAALAAGPGSPMPPYIAAALLQPATYVASPGGPPASPGAAVAGAAAPPAPQAVYYVPGPGATTCTAVDSFPVGKLCTAQEVVTVVQTGEPTCNEYTAQCSGSSGSKTERRVLRPRWVW